MSRPSKYTLLKNVSMMLGGAGMAWMFFAGFCFGEDNYTTGVITLSIGYLIYMVDYHLTWWLYEEAIRRNSRG